MATSYDNIVDYETSAQQMHRAVDGMAGDNVLVKIPPADFVAVKGFVLIHFDRSEPVDTVGLDAMPHRERIKLRKELVGGLEPDPTWRFKAAKLAGGNVVYQLSGRAQSEGSAHWLFDLQKTSDAP